MSLSPMISMMSSTCLADMSRHVATCLADMSFGAFQRHVFRRHSLLSRLLASTGELGSAEARFSSSLFLQFYKEIKEYDLVQTTSTWKENMLGVYRTI